MELDEELCRFKALCSEKTLQKEAQGFFFGLVEKVQPFVNQNLLKSLPTDLEKVKYCTSTFWDLIGAELVVKTKSQEDAAEKRLEGNDAFVKGDYKRALRLYCQSVIRAPPGVDLAMVLSNRSTLFQKMGDLQLALDDAELSVANDYPMDKRHKLYERMASCYAGLDRYQDAKRTVHLAKHLGEKNAESDPKFWQKLNKLQASINQSLKSSPKKSDNKNSPKASEQLATDLENLEVFSKKFPSASCKFDVRHSETEGRYAVAIKEMAPAEVVLRESAFASCLMPARMGTHCLDCFKRIRAAYACDNCANVAFCSRECKKRAEKYHKYECKILTLLIGSGMSELSHLALRIITQSSLQDFKQKIKGLKPDPTQVLLNDEGKFQLDSYENIFNLCALEEERSSEDFFHRCVMTVFLMKCLRLVGYFEINLFKERYPNEDELFIGSLLLRNLQVLQFNAYEITELLMKSKNSFVDTKPLNLGLGIYSTAALLNHSCAPNVTRYFEGTKIVVHTIGTVAAGTPLSDNYGPIFTKFAAKDRRFNLAGRYWFSCKCPACVENWPLLQAFQELNELKGRDKALDQLVSKLESLISAFFAKGMDALQRGNALVAIEYVKKFLEEVHKLKQAAIEASKASNIPSSLTSSTFHFSKSFYLAQDALKLLLSLNGSKFIIE